MNLTTASDVLNAKLRAAVGIGTVLRRSLTALLLIATCSASLSHAGIQRPVCNGSPGPGGVSGDTVWNGNWTALNGSGWFEGTNFIRTLSDGPVGQMAGDSPGGNPDYSVCWSLSPFTVDNTANGETCTNTGPLPYTTGQTYYRMNIDRSVTPTEYCQVAMVTAASAPGIGDTFVVALAAGSAASIPTMPLWLMGLTAGLLSLFGARTLRKA